MYLNPDRMTGEMQLRIVRWLEANGCRHWIALEPIVVKGQWIEYVAICRKDRKSLERVSIRNHELVLLGRKRVRIRVPLKAVA